MKLSIAALAGTAAAVVLATTALTAGAATAAGTGRLAGQDVAATLTTLSSTDGAAIGATYTVFWDFTPRCATGSCRTTFSHLEDDWVAPAVGFPLALSSGRYLGHGSYPSACYDSRGNIVADAAYTETESLTVRPTSVTAGQVRRFTGTYRVTRVLTPAGSAHGCAAGGTSTYRVASS